MPLPTLPTLLGDVVDEATGRAGRDDPVVDAGGGPAGNARMTAWTGLILLALILAQLVTLLAVDQLVSWHIVIGTLLVPFALLKTLSTFWRVGRYYTGHRPYRTAGPPVTVLRVLGPLVVLSTLGLLGSGLALVALGPSSSRRPFVTALGQQVSALTVHQAVFFVFAAVTGAHLLARILPAVRHVTGRSVASATGARGRVPGGGRRGAVLVVTLAFAAVAATLVLGASSSWRHDHRGFDGPPGRFGPQVGAPPH